MRTRSDVVAPFEVSDFADELDDFLKFGQVLRDGISAAHQNVFR